MTVFSVCWQQACRCGSSECRGVIGGKFQRSGQVGPHSLRARRALTTVPPPLPTQPPPPPPPPPPVGGVKSHQSKLLSCAGSVTRAQEKVAPAVGSRCLPSSLAVSPRHVVSCRVMCRFALLPGTAPTPCTAPLVLCFILFLFLLSPFGWVWEEVVKSW